MDPFWSFFSFCLLWTYLFYFKCHYFPPSCFSFCPPLFNLPPCLSLLTLVDHKIKCEHYFLSFKTKYCSFCFYFENYQVKHLFSSLKIEKRFFNLCVYKKAMPLQVIYFLLWNFWYHVLFDWMTTCIIMNLEWYWLSLNHIESFRVT